MQSLAPQLESSPCAPQLDKAQCKSEDPVQQEKKSNEVYILRK